jgi:hypothetical protein
MNVPPPRALGAALAPVVPDWLIGAWQRDLLEWDDGEDRSTQVLWLQSPILFADIRVPAPGAGESEGFAGHLDVTGQTCRWHRPIDVHPKGGDGDVGVIFRRGKRLIECGVHRNYLEEWQLIADGEQHLAATRGAVSIGKSGPNWRVNGALEIAVAVGGHLIHAWRGAGGAGLAYGRFWDEGRGEIERRAGVATPTRASGNWRIWSTTIDPARAERLLARL